MLSRSHSAATDRISRSNSCLGVKQQRSHPLQSESSDTARTNIHALIAAHRAMDRSRGSGSQTLGRSESTASQSSRVRHGQPAYRQGSPAAELRRQRSILQAKTPSLAGSLPYTSGYLYHESLQDTTNLPPSSDFGESYDAEPSSYRKLRKARSMLAPSRHEQCSDGTKTPFSQARTLRHAASNVGFGSGTIGLRLRRSLDFLRIPSRTQSSPGKLRLDVSPRPEAVQLAREQFLRQQDQPPTQEHHTRQPRKQKALRKSMKSSHTGRTEDEAISQHSTPETIHVKKVRSISASLRNRFKTTFLTLKSQEGSLPPQQLESSRPHFGSFSTNQISGFNSYNDEYLNDHSRHGIYFSPDDDAAKMEDIENIWHTVHTDGSHESITSNARSRVTSWTNSTVTGSLHESCPERKRLSVIKEDGSPHQPSSSAGRHFGGVSVSYQDSKSHNRSAATSKRLYSALVKHMNGKSSNEMEMQTQDVDNNELAEEMSASNEFQKSTIRPVSRQSSDGPVAQESTYRESSVSKPVAMDLDRYGSEPTSNNANKWKQKLRAQEAQSSFFPHSAEDKVEATSPYRKAMLARRSEEEDQLVIADCPIQPVARTHSWNHRLPEKKHTLSSESIYSRTTHGGTNSQYERPIFSREDLPLDLDESSLETGFATIVPTRSWNTGYRGDPDFTPITNLTIAEKNTWKGWMEDQMSDLRRSSSKANRHVRENAQISSAEESHPTRNTSISKNAACALQSTSSQSNVQRDCRTPTSSSTILEQLTLPKRRVGLLDVNNVSGQETAELPKPQSSLQSQSGLSDEWNDKQSGVTHEKSTILARKLSVPLRKISPTNVAKFLRRRKSSIPTVSKSGAGKENSCKVDTDTPTTDQLLHSDLQTWSGNARFKSSNVDKGADIQGESPSDRIKATLSARLSRPFDMETPECNRPFDSMYLGKREMGHADYIGGRLSVANGATQQRSLGGYGGLGTPALDSQILEEEPTALPHFPTPENERKKAGPKTGMASSSKRMVSNFLRSRRSTLTKNVGGRDENKRDGTDEK